jgi:hypothetical protein
MHDLSVRLVCLCRLPAPLSLQACHGSYPGPGGPGQKQGAVTSNTRTGMGGQQVGVRVPDWVYVHLITNLWVL